MDNAALLEGGEGWELIQFRSAKLTRPGAWRLRGLLRGQGGSVSAAADAGARVLLLGSRERRRAVSATEAGMDLILKAGGGGVQVHRFASRETLPWQPCHLRVRSGTAT